MIAREEVGVLRRQWSPLEWECGKIIFGGGGESFLNLLVLEELLGLVIRVWG